MENRKHLKFLLLTIGIIAMPIFVSAYDDEATHPALTDEVVDFFNYTYPQLKISDSEKEIIKQGSVDEDLEPRWMHHFYDPVYNGGLGTFSSSKEWSQKWPYKATLLASPNTRPFNLEISETEDRLENLYTWQRAVYDYAYGDRNRALLALGHVLHLIEDKAVPDHTRNDSHNPSPYEHWAKDFTDKNIKIFDELKSKGETPTTLASLDEYFDEEAKYSNGNFFSKDTIFDSNYAEPTGNGEIRNNNKIFITKDGHILVEKTYLLNKASMELETKYLINDQENLVFSDYWSLLSKHVVKSGAGVVKLFFDEVEKEKQSGVLLSKNKSYTEIAAAKIKSTAGAAFAFLKNTLTLSINKFGLTSSVAEIPEEIISNNLQLTIDGASNETQITNEEPEPIKVSTKPEQEKITSKPPQTQLLSTPPQTDASDLLAVSFPYPGFGGGGGSIPTNSLQLTSDDLNTIPTPEVVGTSTPDALIGTGDNVGATSPQETNNETATSTPQNETPNTATSTPQTEGATTTPPIIIPDTPDTTAPEVAISILECENSLSPSACLLTPNATGSQAMLNIFWSSTSTDLEIFELTNNTGEIFATTSTSTIIFVNDNSVNNFSVRAKDTAGNWSTPQVISITINSTPVVINEIAWAGGSSITENDEWIELYNRTNMEVSLDTFRLYSLTDMSPNINLSGIVPAKGFYLIERNSDNAVSDIPADLVASFGYGLGNRGEELALSVGSAIIDKTGICPLPNRYRWPPCGNGFMYRTTERINANTSGESFSNWDANIYPSIIKNGKDSLGQPISGTPKNRNSVAYLINNNSQNITQDMVLKKENGPYVVNDTLLIVKNGATLTIEPGVVIKFNGGGSTSGIRVENGKILAQGTENEKIVFTFWGDSEFLLDGSINSNAEMSSAYGGWMGIEINSPGSIFENVLIRSGGKYYNGVPSARAGLSQNGGSIVLKNSIVEWSMQNGLKLVNNSDPSEISNNIFRSNNNPSNNDACGLYAESSYINLQGNTFANNKTGIKLFGVSGVAENNIFENNETNLVINNSTISFKNNVGIENDPPTPEGVGAPTPDASIGTGDNVGVLEETSTSTPTSIESGQAATSTGENI